MVRGVEFELLGEPPRVILEDYPYVRGWPEVAATDLDPLSAMGEIRWYPLGRHPPDLRPSPSHLIAKLDDARAVHDWPDAAYGPDDSLVNPSAEYGDVGGLPQLLTPVALMAEWDSHGCPLLVCVACG